MGIKPHFVIIGAQRGGTTSLYAYLREHPQVVPAASKELHFFTERYGRGLDWYLDQFPTELPAGTLTGEATPYYLFHPWAPTRLHAAAPHTKLIVLLRNPVDRAYSHWSLQRSRGTEPLDFAAALKAEPGRIGPEEARLLSDPTYVSSKHRMYSYLARGDYAPQLERWFNVFPQEGILVVRSEDLFQRTAETFGRVTAFLRIATNVRLPFAVHNRSDELEMDPAIRLRLEEHFAPRNARLAELLGWDPAWREMGLGSASSEPRPCLPEEGRMSRRRPHRSSQHRRDDVAIDPGGGNA